MLTVRRRKLLLKAFVSLAIVAMMIFPVSAFSAGKVVHYDALVMTHLYADEFSNVAMYYNYRAMMYYELALSTGDGSFLLDCREAIEDMLYNLDAIFDTPICARDLQGIVVELEKLVSLNLKTLDSLEEVFQSNDSVNDTTNIKALIAEVDALNEKILTEVDSLISPTKLDLMRVGDLSFAVHALQQANMVAFYSNVVDTAEALNFFEDVTDKREHLKNYFLTTLEGVVNKTSDAALKDLKRQIGVNFNSIYSEAENLINRVSEYKFPEVKAIDVETNFIEISFEIDDWFQNGVVGVEFT